VSLANNLVPLQHPVVSTAVVEIKWTSGLMTKLTTAVETATDLKICHLRPVRRQHHSTVQQIIV
jgi:hypothetical protein